MRTNNPFLDILPSLDLHGYTSDMIYVLVSSFIDDNIKLCNKKIVIIHGIGRSILKNKLYELFLHDKRVSNMHLDSSNLGCTIIELK